MAGYFRNSSGDCGIMGYMIFSFTVNHFFLVFLLPTGILFLAGIRYLREHFIFGFNQKSDRIKIRFTVEPTGSVFKTLVMTYEPIYNVGFVK